jgi:dihydrolipoamide dehydrogenase
MLAHKAVEGIGAAEYMHSGQGHVNSETVPSAGVYASGGGVDRQHGIGWLKKEGVRYNVGRFPFLANLRAKTNLDTEYWGPGQVS